VRVTGQDWNWKTPWVKQAPRTRVLTGLVVAGPRLLVASPAFGNSLLIEVQKHGRQQRTPARLVLVDHEGPLALLDVDDPSFWEGLSPLPLAEKLPVSGEVTVHRWLRAAQFEASRAAVAQVRSGRHGSSRVGLLTLELSSNLEGAGESEVVMAGGAVVGLATSKSGDVLSALAAPVLRQFLDDAAHPPYRGFARVGVAWQELQNPALRERLGLLPGEGGVRITRVFAHGAAAGVLDSGDVILEVAGVPVDPAGQFDHPLYGRLDIQLLFTDGRRPGDRLDLRILRNGERRTVALTLARMPPESDRVPPYVVDRAPEYAVFGGLVFQHLSGPYLATWPDWTRRAPPRLLIAFDRDGIEPTPEQPRFVVLSSVLPDASNLGYHDLRDLIVTAVNGERVGSLDDLREAFARPQAGFHVIEFLPGQATRRIVLDASEAAQATGRIRAAYGITP
jgi:S1-C subfamily serine protease